MVMVFILPMLSSEKQNDWHSFTAGSLVSCGDLPGHGHCLGGAGPEWALSGRL